MKGHYVGLAIGVVVLALALTVLGRPRSVERPAPPVVDAPIVALAVTIEGDRLSPASASIPKGARVRLEVQVRGTRGASLALSGYEDRLSIPTLSPGATWTGEFIADRPGEDFAWLINGVPAGRLAISGSHLIEGHR